MGSVAAQATEYAPAECGPEEDPSRSRQHDLSSGRSALGLVSPSPVSSRVAAATRDWLAAAHPECVTPPDIASATHEVPETPNTDETYEPTYKRLDYEDYEDYEDDEDDEDNRTLVEGDPIDHTIPAGAETPEGPVPGHQIDV